MQLGFYTFADLIGNPVTGVPVTAAQRIRDILDYARIADETGLDIVGVGEHHGSGFANSATAATIAAMAAVTKNIRFTSASTQLATADPVRTYQEFATADLVSNGRVELIFGRGAFTENFPLFGYGAEDYDAAFIEKLHLFKLLNNRERVTWSGKYRPPLRDAEIAPRSCQPRLPVSVGALSPGSVARAAELGYPLTIPMVGGSIDRYAQIADHYREVWVRAGHAEADIRIAGFSHLHVGETSQDTREGFYPYYSAYMRPFFGGQKMPRQVYDQLLSRDGAFVGGSPEEVVDKLGRIREALGLYRYVGQIDIGGQDRTDVMRGIERLALNVAPALRQAG